LPIARQTSNVNGTQAQGSTDAEANSEDLIATFGQEYLASQGGQFLMFLDVEGSPSLSSAYFSGWADTLTAIMRWTCQALRVRRRRNSERMGVKRRVPKLNSAVTA
jgi:hypothetical protein